MLIMNILALMSYNLKDGSVGSPTIYLDAENKKYQVKCGQDGRRTVEG
jgi:hypothetical protein